MEGKLENPTEEIKRLRRCINDLVSVLALSATWSGCEPSRIARTVLDVLLGLVNLDLVYIRLEDSTGESPIVEMVWSEESRNRTVEPQRIRELLKQCLGHDSQKWPSSVRTRLGDEDILLVPFRLGLQGEIGVIVAGSRRLDFPMQTERLLLNVAVNQVAIWSQEARLLSEQKRLASELDLRVAEQTLELAAANKELKKEIAERRHVEERLREEERELKLSEARKTAILNSALDCIVTIDHEARITEFNPAAERTFGHGRDEVVGKPLADVIIPASLREHHHRGFARYLATGQEHVLGRRIETTAVRADGSEFPVELAITRIPFDGSPSFTGYLRDITDRKQAEEKLRRSEAYLAQAQKLSKTGSFGWNPSTDKHFWSDETFRIFQYDASTKVTLQMILERVHPEDVQGMKQIVDRAAQDGRDWEHEYRLLLPDGSVKHVYVVAHAEKNSSAGSEFVGAVIDITERKQTEGRIRQIIDTIPAYAWSTGPDGSVDFINRRYLEFTGRPIKELLGSGWISTCHPDDLPRHVALRGAATATGVPMESEVRVRRNDGHYRWLLLRNVPLRDETGNIVKWYGTAIDIEDRKRAEEALRRGQADLAHVSRLTTMGEFAASIAHEVNQPLTAIINNANACLGILPDSTPDLQETRTVLGEIIEDADRASAVVRRVRQLAKKTPPDRTLLDLKVVVLDVLALARHESTSRRVAIVTDLSMELPPVLGDRVQLQQVLLNLFVNGMDAMNAVEESKRILKISVRCELQDGKPVCLLSVQDAGVGFQSNEMDRLFEAFYTTKPQGMGMGLAISRSIIEAHGGQLRAEPNKEAGATFIFSLPAAGNATT
jgi:PAS domain S-box-containing protein